MIARPDESFEVIDLLLVTSLEPIDRKPRAGRQRKKSGGPGRWSAGGGPLTYLYHLGRSEHLCRVKETAKASESSAYETV